MAKRSDGGIRWGAGHERFCPIPTWVMDLDVSDRAVRLYLMLGFHANDEGRSYPSKPRLMKLLRCARSTLDLAAKELVDAGALVVEPRQRDDGSQTSNDYTLAWSNPLTTQQPPSDGSEGSPSHGSEALEELEPVGTKDLTRFARSVSDGGFDWGTFGDPPKLAHEEGANRAFDAILASCGVEVGSPRMREVATALNGDKRKLATHPGINRMFWLECARDVDSLTLDEAMRFVHDKATEHPARWQESLTARIYEKARKHVDAYDFDLTPSTLAKYWLDLEQKRDDGFLTSDEIRRGA